MGHPTTSEDLLHVTVGKNLVKAVGRCMIRKTWHSPSTWDPAHPSSDVPGERPFLLTCSGSEKTGALCMMRPSVTPTVITRVPLPGGGRGGRGGGLSPMCGVQGVEDPSSGCRTGSLGVGHAGRGAQASSFGNVVCSSWGARHSESLHMSSSHRRPWPVGRVVCQERCGRRQSARFRPTSPPLLPRHEFQGRHQAAGHRR